MFRGNTKKNALFDDARNHHPNANPATLEETERVELFPEGQSSPGFSVNLRPGARSNPVGG